MEDRLSMWTSFFMDLSPEDALRELARAGWPCAELSDEHSRALLERGTRARLEKSSAASPRTAA